MSDLAIESGAVREPTFDFSYEVGGVEVTVSFFARDVPTILGWSTSQAILYLGADAPKLQEGLRRVFGE
jgi:hypothetical protein